MCLDAQGFGGAREILDDLQPVSQQEGYRLLDMLEDRGWSVYTQPGFGGGVLLIAERDAYPFLRAEARSQSIGEAALQLVIECNRLVRPPAAAA